MITRKICSTAYKGIFKIHKNTGRFILKKYQSLLSITVGILKSSNPRNRNSTSVINSKILSFSSMNTLLAILKVTDVRRDVIPAGRRTEPPISLETPCPPVPDLIKMEMVNYVAVTPFTARFSPGIFYVGVLRFQVFPSAFPSLRGVLFRRIYMKECLIR